MPSKAFNTALKELAEGKKIVKVQRALFPPDQVECLVYDEDQNFLCQQVVSKATLKAMEGRPGMFAMKAYFIATFNAAERKWDIGEMVQDQDW